MKKDKVLIGAMIALLAANVAFLFWYVLVGYQSLFHSDSAAKVLLAREIYDTGSFFPKDWNYVNNDLFILFGHIFILPLLTFMPAGFTAHAISGGIFAALILYGIWLVTSLGNIPVWRRLAVVAVMASGISGFMAENLYGQVSYGVVVFFCCYTLYFASQYLSAEGKTKLKWAALLVILLTLAYWSNPKRAIVSYGLPLLVALGWLFLSSDSSDRRKYLNLIGLSLLGATVGSMLHLPTINAVNNIPGAGNARWLPLEGVLINTALTFKGLYAQLGGLLLANESIFSKQGLYSGLRFFVATLVLVLLPVAINRAVAKYGRNFKLVALFSAVSFLAVFFLQVATTIPDMSDPIQSSRYLVPAVVLGLVVILMLPLDFEQRPPVLAVSIMTVGVTLLFSAYPTYRMSGLSSETLSQPGQINPERRGLLEIIKERGLQYGYATYWNAGVLSVLSNEKARIRQIVLHNGIPVPMRHLSSNRWYRPSAWEGKTFLLLHDSELAHLDLNKMQRLGLVPREQIRSHDFTIFVFGENIARYLPGWDTRYVAPARFLPSATTPSQVGRLVENGGSATLVAEKGETGALHYGPYVDVEPGRYRVTFDLTANHNPAGVARLDVAAAPDQKLYGEKTLTESNAPQVIEFDLDKTRTLEFRVWALGNERVVFNGVSIQRVGDVQ
jgi:hypothetical protein